MRIDLYSHHFCVSEHTREEKELLLGFARNFVEWGFDKTPRGKFVRVKKRVFAASTRLRDEFRFHISTLESFYQHMGAFNVTREKFSHTQHNPPQAVVTPNMKMKGHWQDKDYQTPIIDYIVSEGAIKVVTLQTGKGKTYIAERALEQIKKRTVIVIQGMYVDKWKGDLREGFGFSPNEIMVVRGSKHLRDLIEMGRQNAIPKSIAFIIITAKTMYNFLSHYVRFDGDTSFYGCHPVKFFGVIGAGVRLIDEVHQDFHLNFRMDLYTNIEKTVSLSATVESDNPFITRMYETMFPLDERMVDVGYDRYISAKALFYSLENPHKIKYKQRGRRSYSHVVFEQNIMKHKKTLDNYLRMIVFITEQAFVAKRQSGQRMLIFCATKELCRVVAKRLQQHYPTLDISEYLSEDPLEKLTEQNDISVSTIQSAGTAHDIPGLRTVLSTVAIGSRVANSQMLGRLRRLKDYPEVTPEFLYLVCSDIAKHHEYHEKRKENFRDKTKTVQEYRLNSRI